MTGKNYDDDAAEFEGLARMTRQYAMLHPAYSDQELASGVAKKLDQRNGNSPSTNGLLAIALVKLARHSFHLSQARNDASKLRLAIEAIEAELQRRNA